MLKEFKINPDRIYILRDPLTCMKAQWFDTKTTVHAHWPNNLRFKPPIFMKSCIFGNILNWTSYLIKMNPKFS